MRLIDADALMSQVKRSREKNPYTGAMLGSLNAVYDFTHRDVLNLINSAPTIDAEPVQHGRWLPETVSGYDGVNVVYARPCSECGYEERRFVKRYCPNCGAKMDEEEKQ